MKIPAITAFAAVVFSSFTFAEPVNINTADADLIAASLIGVGKQKAMAIVEFRVQHGPFLQPDDIVMVKGIGQSTYQKNKADILVK
jgi:competence protein ComEA